MPQFSAASASEIGSLFQKHKEQIPEEAQLAAGAAEDAGFDELGFGDLPDFDRILLYTLMAAPPTGTEAIIARWKLRLLGNALSLVDLLFLLLALVRK